MKLLMLDQFSDLGGAQRCLEDLVPAIHERGWQAWVAAPGDGLLLRRMCAAGIRVEALNCGRYGCGSKSPGEVARFAWEVPRLGREIRGLCARHSPDLVYVNGPRLLPAVAWGLGDGPPVLFHAHSYLPKRYAAWLAGWSLRRLHATVVGSCNFVVRPLKPYLDSSPVRVVYNGVDLAAAMPARAGLRVGVIGRIAPEKGQAEFLGAARLVHALLPQCRFVVCGAPLFGNRAAQRYAAWLKELARGLPVEFLGWRNDVARVLASLDLLVVPSAALEATPRVILEAYAARIPVLASRSGGISEIVTDGVTGFLVDPLEPVTLARAILDLCTTPGNRLREVAARAHEMWSRRFTVRRYQDEMAEIILRASQNGG